MKNTVGSAVTLTLFGESHGPAVGVVVDGLAPGLAVDETAIAAEMEKRRAAGPLATERHEPDEVEILSGVFRGATCGTPLCLVVKNQNANSGDYPEEMTLPRPGHADYAGHKKYFGYEDHRGGGHFSGRLTAPLVAAGAIFRDILAQHGILLATHLLQCGPVWDDALPADGPELDEALRALNGKTFPVLNADAAERMQKGIAFAKSSQSSVGGILETVVCGLSPGVGEPFFGTVEGVLSTLLYAVPGVKSVGFGAGCSFSAKPGEDADEFYWKNGEVRTIKNHNGGVNGGVTNGMPLVIRTAVKPTPTIARPLRTVNLATGEDAQLASGGRHDACIAPRARAAVDALCAFGLVDLYTQRHGTLWQNPVLHP